MKRRSTKNIRKKGRKEGRKVDSTANGFENSRCPQLAHPDGLGGCTFNSRNPFAILQIATPFIAVEEIVAVSVQAALVIQFSFGPL